MCLGVLMSTIGAKAASYPVYEDLSREVRDADPHESSRPHTHSVDYYDAPQQTYNSGQQRAYYNNGSQRSISSGSRKNVAEV